MYLPSTYAAQLAFLFASMVCWGSWANTVKLTPGWRFQSFYWDYVIGVLLGSFLWGLGLAGGSQFLERLGSAAGASILWAVLAGVVFNAANQLLVAAIDLAGLAVAFPVGIGLALVVGVTLNYLLAPAANPVLLFLGVALVAIAIVVDAIAYRKRERDRPAISRLGIVITVISGLMMGGFYPILTRAMQGPGALDAYTVVPFFAVGLALCAIPVNLWMMRRPMVGEPVAFSNYLDAKASWHLWGIVGGIVWNSGLQANLVASRAQLVGPAVSYALGQGATMISAAWGVFIWREFRDAPRGTGRLLAIMFLFFLTGLGLIALAPAWR
ncbi:MAG TPA: GRP family sugar transporter [Edaphobacter sp.]|nr:GRP family sugar transporter [Edaphobacter sp.]